MVAALVRLDGPAATPSDTGIWHRYNWALKIVQVLDEGVAGTKRSRSLARPASLISGWFGLSGG